MLFPTGRERGAPLGQTNVRRSGLPEIGTVLELKENDWRSHEGGAEQERAGDAAGGEHARVKCGPIAGEADRQQQQHGGDQAGREAEARDDERRDVEEQTVDEHQRGKAERDARRSFGEIGGHDAKHHDHEIDHVEHGPIDRQDEHRPRPVAPVEHEFLERVHCVSRRREPEPM